MGERRVSRCEQKPQGLIDTFSHSGTISFRPPARAHPSYPELPRQVSLLPAHPPSLPVTPPSKMDKL